MSKYASIAAKYPSGSSRNVARFRTCVPGGSETTRPRSIINTRRPASVSRRVTAAPANPLPTTITSARATLPT